MTRPLQFAADVFILGASFIVAYLLRFDFAIPWSEVSPLIHQLASAVLLQMVALEVTGVRTFVWRYVGMAELKAFVRAAVGPATVMVVLRLVLSPAQQVWRVPLSVIVVDTILAFGAVLGARVVRRGLQEYRDRHAAEQRPLAKTPVLLIGAGRAGIAAAREIHEHGTTHLDIRGFVDDDPNKIESVIYGIRVVGTTTDLPRLVAAMNIDHVVISLTEASRQQLKRIHDICDAIPVKVRIIPAMHEILQGTVSFSRIRDVEIEDLLGRDPIHLDEADIRSMLTGTTVMVTGAGGSIGSELVRQAARFGTSDLVLVERCEFALYNIEREMRALRPQMQIHALMADIGDGPRMRQILTEYRPKVIVHAAAHKHVPMMELNPGEAIKNNVLATRTLAELAGTHGVEVFVLISTDKAVRPRSVMGASKRLAELVVQSLSGQYPTRFEAVRFGNVIGSTGSVIPLFREQIARGGPVTVTHPDMTRYFMTIPEAAQLVLEAAAIGEGGELFILDMGEPVKIVDLAKDVITLTGLRPFEDIDIAFTGLRPGEKLYEELETTGERIAKTRHPKIFMGKIAAPSIREMDHALATLMELSTDGRDQRLREFLNAFLPDALIDGLPIPQPELGASLAAEARA
jgi:FlaA1/EpsC-like NDP-sugar epimerase